MTSVLESKRKRKHAPDIESPAPKKHRPERLQPETLFLVDWDDTLCPTSWIGRMELSPMGKKEVGHLKASSRSKLRKHDRQVRRVLRRLSALGRTVIVTAAQAGWVEQSASIFMPKTFKYITSHVQVISARDFYKRQCIDPNSRNIVSSTLWKLEAFKAQALSYYRNKSSSKYLDQVYAIGDSMGEHEALQVIMSAKDGADSTVRSRSVRFTLNPSLLELRRELQDLHQGLEYMINHPSNLVWVAEKSEIQVTNAPTILDE